MTKLKVVMLSFPLLLGITLLFCYIFINRINVTIYHLCLFFYFLGANFTTWRIFFPIFFLIFRKFGPFFEIKRIKLVTSTIPRYFLGRSSVVAALCKNTST